MANPSPIRPRRTNTTSLSPPLICFTNCLLCVHGELLPQDLYFSPETGLITPNYYFRADNVDRVDMGGRIIAPGFLELQTNGMGGIHFTNLASLEANHNDESDEQKLSRVAAMELEAGVTGWWATVPTVPKHRWKEILPCLTPRSFPFGADLLGAHVEGPYLHPSKKGAHNDAFFQLPDDPTARPGDIYDTSNLLSPDDGGNIRMITLAPELPGTVAMIGYLREEYPHIAISLGHSSASYTDGLATVSLGARMLTHTFNAMQPLNHRNPGLAGLMSTGRVWYSIIPDGIHVHPSVLTLAIRADPTKCILITDSIELAGLPDGIHEGHGQIGGKQLKQGNKVTLDGTDTLVGSCIRLDECVRNMVEYTRCSLAEAVRCVTENVAQMMGEGKRGVLEAGRRADFVVLGGGGGVEETWMGGRRVWERGREMI